MSPNYHFVKFETSCIYILLKNQTNNALPQVPHIVMET